MKFKGRPPTLKHVVLISFRDGVSEEIRQGLYSRFQRLAEDCGGKKAGVLSWSVDWNLDTRKNVHLVEIAEFESDEALQKFRAHPKHKELTDILCKVADWWVGDVHTEKQARWVEWLGLFATALSVGSFVPAAYKIWSALPTPATSTSYWWCFLFNLGVSAWLIYGLKTKSRPVWLTNVLIGVLALSIFVYKIIYG